jgi:hypothetical protein
LSAWICKTAKLEKFFGLLDLKTAQREKFFGRLDLKTAPRATFLIMERWLIQAAC